MQRITRSRIEEFLATDFPYDDPPEPDSAGYLLSWLDMSGRVMPGPAGPVALSWQEIEAFDRSHCLRMRANEKQMLRSLSQTYCSGLVRHRDPASDPPYYPENGKLATLRRERARAREQRDHHDD